MNNGAIHIAMASDERFAMHLNVAAASVLANSDKSRTVCFHILHDGLSVEAKGKFESLKGIRHFETDWLQISHDDFKEFHIPRNLSAMANARLKIPELLPAGVGRVLYLDCDIIALDDVGKLWDSDLGGKSAGAVRDYGRSDRKIRKTGILGRDYFNSGVMLMDLERLRANGFTARCSASVNSENAPKEDQNVLNIVLRGDWLPLPLRWNVEAPVTAKEAKANGFDDIPAVIEAMASPGIIHFTSYKPSSYLFDGIGGDLYFKYLTMTGYSSFKVNDRSLRNIIVRHSPKRVRTRVRHLLDRLRF